MPDKLMPAEKAVRDYVRPGSTVFVGGFGQGVPFALGREIIRQGVSGLRLCRTGADILFDLLVGAGAADRLLVGWFGNPGVGISHVCRRALKAGSLTLEETSNFGLLLRLEAAALGVPFLPTRTLCGGDLPAVAAAGTVRCPFTGETVSAVQALEPDVAILHAHRADRDGNVQAWGILGDTVAGARAARRVICSVEEVVDGALVRAEAGRTILPAHRVDAVVEAPWGAWPSYVEGRYERDDTYYRRFDRSSRDPDWVAGLVRSVRAAGGEPDVDTKARLAWPREAA